MVIPDKIWDETEIIKNIQEVRNNGNLLQCLQYCKSDSSQDLDPNKRYKCHMPFDGDLLTTLSANQEVTPVTVFKSV